MKLLVTIANHGTSNRKYLDKLLASYQSMPIETKIVILSNIPKDLGPDIEVIVGTPTSNPWSLPFGYISVFEKNLEDFDFFIYSEDDTLVEYNHIESFAKSVDTLKDDEITGFIRTETEANGAIHYSSCHSFFRWKPKSIRNRNGKLWAEYSNQHAAFFIATKDQIKTGLKSGGLPQEPHEGRFDMLCSAATDIYTSCGLTRLINVDDLDNHTIKHLPNKYIGVLGTPEEELNWQIDALRKIDKGELPSDSLFEPETKLPHGFGSKFCREFPDPILNDTCKGPTSDVLFWGSGDGYLEQSFLEKTGHRIKVTPLDSIMGECCTHRGIQLNSDEKAKFDFIVIVDSLHLIPDPQSRLKALSDKLNPGGKIVARIPNLRNYKTKKKRAKDSRFSKEWDRKSIGASPFTASELRRMLKSINLTEVKTFGSPIGKSEKLNRLTLGLFSTYLSDHLYLVAKK